MDTLRTAWKLIVDIATGLVLFAALTAAAVGAHHVARWGEVSGLHPLIVRGLEVLEFGFAVADAVCVAFAVLYAMRKFIRSLTVES